MFKKLLTLSLSILIFSCGEYEDLDPIDDSEDPQPETPTNGGGGGSSSSATTFGIRSDKDLSDYELVATNSGSFSTSEYPDFTPVVKFCYSIDGSDNQEYVGTGTFITNQWILTAAHNFFVSDEQTEPAKPEGIQVIVGNNPNTSNIFLDVEQVVLHPTWASSSQFFDDGNDICLVKLKEPYENVTPSIVNFDVGVEELGTTVWFAGFGDYSQQPGQDANALSNKHAIENVLDRILDNVTSSVNGVTYNGGLLAFDFDNADGTINSLGDDVVNDDESRLGGGTSDAAAKEYEGTTVQGDSGGPLFVSTSTGWVVAGVLSGGATEPIANHQDSSYGDISIFIRTASHEAWIKSVVGI